MDTHRSVTSAHHQPDQTSRHQIWGVGMPCVGLTRENFGLNNTNFDPRVCAFSSKRYAFRPMR